MAETWIDWTSGRLVNAARQPHSSQVICRITLFLAMPSRLLVFFILDEL